MKKIQYFSLAAFVMAGTLLAGCSKVENEEPQVEDNIVTVSATVNLDNATRALSDGGEKTFAVGDQIAVLYQNQNKTAVSAPLTDSDISDGGKTATFTISLINPSNGTVTYVYPAAMAGENGTVNLAALYKQDGTLTTLSREFDYAQGSGEMTVSGTTATLPTDVALVNQLAFCKFDILNNGGSSISNTITKLSITDGEYHYVITRTAAAGPIYIAMNPVEDTKTISVIATDGTVDYFKDNITGKALAANKMYDIEVTMGPARTREVNGQFSVSADKKVVFSRGNLQARGATTSSPNVGWYWYLAQNQYDFIDYAAANTKINGNGTLSEGGNVDLFGWSTPATYYGINNSTAENAYSGDFVDWGGLIDEGWRTLSSAEWDYLIGPDANEAHRPGNRYAKASIHIDPTDPSNPTVNGLIIFPDGFTKPSTVQAPLSMDTYNAGYADCPYADWNTLKAAGCVFLPEAGTRGGASNTRTGDYWTSSLHNDTSAKYIHFWNDIVGCNYFAMRKVGFSVRLVRDIPVSTGSITVGDYNVENPATW